MTLVALDTSSARCGVAVVRSGEIVSNLYSDIDRQHATALMPMLEKALAEAGATAANIDVWAAVTGPGSFTGVRQAVVCARAMAHVTGKLCLGVSALEALAFPYYNENTVAALIDARHGLLYAGIYSSGRSIRAEEAINIDDLFGILPRNKSIMFVGDGALVHKAAIQAAIGPLAVFGEEERRFIDPAAAALLAYIRREKASGAAQLKPIYLRQSSAERARQGEQT